MCHDSALEGKGKTARVVLHGHSAPKILRRFSRGPERTRE